MTDLEELEKKLYSPSGEKETEKRMWRRVFFRSPSRKSPSAWAGAEREERETSARRLRSFASRTFLLYGVSAGFLFLLIAAGVFILFYVGTRGSEAKISFDVRPSVEAGAPTAIPVLVENVSRSRLKEIEFALILPPGTLLRDEEGAETLAPPRITRKIDDLAPGDAVTFEYKTRFFGRPREEQTIEGILLYKPESLGARFTVRAQAPIVVERVPLSLSWELPKTAARGQEIEGVVRYGSSAQLPFDNLFLRVAYPPGFSFVSGDPKPDLEDSVWNLGSLAPGSDGAIRFRGTITGEEAALETFRAGLGSFNKSNRAWKPYQESLQETRIAIAPLSVRAEITGWNSNVVSGGESLSVLVRFRNNTEYVIENASVRAEIAGSIFDRSTLAMEDGGVFDFNTQSVVWGSGSTDSLRKLNSGEEGTVRFGVKVLSRPVVRGSGDYNQIGELRARIDAATLPKELEGTDVSDRDTLQLKLASPVLFSARALYQNIFLPPSGSHPPAVGQKTVYTIVWEVRNFTNDIGDVSIQTALPPNSEWAGSVFPKGARIFFDQAGARVQWNVGTIPAGTGLTSPALTGAFQVAVTPAHTDRGGAMLLANESVLAGRDLFTETPVQKSQAALYTDAAVQ